jgi:hypothetical protein
MLACSPPPVIWQLYLLLHLQGQDDAVFRERKKRREERGEQMVAYHLHLRRGGEGEEPPANDSGEYTADADADADADEQLLASHLKVSLPADPPKLVSSSHFRNCCSQKGNRSDYKNRVVLEKAKF